MIRQPETPPAVAYRILVVDDNASHSAGIRQLIELQSAHKVVGICTNGDEAIKRIGQVEADIVLMDMNMPEVDGISAIQAIVARQPDVRILALTGQDEPAIIYKAMRAGAKGYLLKTMVTSQLMKALDEVMMNRVFIPTSIATKFFNEFQHKVQQASRPDGNRQALMNYLTGREKEVLRLLTEGITYKGVADRLVISETTVKTHVNNIFQKLQVNDRTQAVLYALRYGLVDNTDKVPTVV